MKKAASYLSLVCCFALSCVPLLAGDPLAPVEKTFANGARVLLAPRPAAGAVLVAVTVAAGGQDEPADRAGMSHFLEHLLFDGFDTLDERAITESFARHAAYDNATTRDQSTIYFVLSPRAEAAASAALIAGMVSRSKIPEASFEKERKVILEELAKDASNPMMADEQALSRLMWADTPWALGSGGTPETVGRATRDDVVSYWKTYYRPDRMRVLVAGDGSLPQLEAIAAPFAAIPRAKGTVPPRQDLRSWKGWGRWRTRTTTGDASLTAMIALPPEVTALQGDLLARWLSQPNGPLSADWSEVSAQRLPREPVDLLALRLVPRKTEAPLAVLTLLIKGLDAIAQRGPSASETESLLTAWRRETVLARQRLHYVAVLEGESFATMRTPLTELFVPTEPTPAAMQQATQRALKGVAPRLRAVWSSAEPSDNAAAPLPVVKPAAQPAVASATTGPVVLDSGVTLSVTQEPGNAVFGITVLIANRAAREPEGMHGVSDLLQRLIGKGSALSDTTHFAQRMADAGIELKTADSPAIPFDDYYNLPEHAYLRMEGPAQSFDTALQLLAEAIKAPRWGDDAWRTALSAFKQARAANTAASTSAASAALKRRVLGPGHPSIGPVAGVASDKEPTSDDARALLGAWPEGWFAPQHLVIGVVSPRSIDDVRSRIEVLFGDAPKRAPQRIEPPAPPASLAPTPTLNMDTPQIALAWGHAVDVPKSDAPALLLALVALSDKMTAEIREKAGMAYRLGAGARALPGGKWWVECSVGTRPENRAAVETQLTALLDKLGSETASAETLTRWVASTRRQEMLDRLAAISRATQLARVTLDGPGSPASVSAEDLAAVTPQQIQDAARRYLAPQQMVSAY